MKKPIENSIENSTEHSIEGTILFGKYRIISVLGAGSSSTVYLARHLKLEVYRAIKCIPKDTAHRMNAVDKSSLFSKDSLLTEANLLKALNHPGIPLIYDIDEDDDSIYMVEEFIQGDSLENFILHQDNISEELIIEYGIQLCDILDYLHHITPYPILYQDLKPEHIILCGNQIKLVDFGIAAFITGSGKNFQHYGTDGFVSPEAYMGHPVSPASDIYGLGKVLSLMADQLKPSCFPQLLHTIEKAAAFSEEMRYQTAADLKNALLEVRQSLYFSKDKQHMACQANSHLIKKIAVIGSRHGAGATHFAVALTAVLNRKGQKSIYMSMDGSDSLSAMTQANIFWKETDGIFRHRHFCGLPHYGGGIENLFPEDAVLIRDYGCSMEAFGEKQEEDLVFFIMSGSIWDMPDTLALARQLLSQQNIVFVCNYDNKKAAKKYAGQLKKTVYCFPFDCDPFYATAKKERLIMRIMYRKEVLYHFRYWKKRSKTSSDNRNHRLLCRFRCHSFSNRTGKSMRL